MRYKPFLFQAILLCMLATNAHSLPEDRNQPIEIESNRVHLDDKNGVTIYEGKVTITQGSIRIKADKVVIANRGDKVSKLVCIGKPAIYQQRSSSSDSLLTAKGNRIEYNIGKDTITLLEKASLEQDSGIITGERIDYNLDQEIVNAKGSSTGNQRIQMVIPPQHIKKNDRAKPLESNNSSDNSNTDRKETP